MTAERLGLRPGRADVAPPPGGSHVQNVATMRGGAQILTFPPVGVGFVSCAPARGAIVTFPTPGAPRASWPESALTVDWYS
jgi:hypothetical protein